MVETDASVAAALVHAHMWDPLVIASPCNRSTPLPLAPIWLPSRCLYPHSVAGWRRAKVPVPGPAADDTARVDLPCRQPTERLAAIRKLASSWPSSVAVEAAPVACSARVIGSPHRIRPNEAIWLRLTLRSVLPRIASLEPSLHAPM